MSNGRLFIVSGPSGTGKGTVLAQAMKTNPSLRMSVSATTRSPREGEVDGVHYHFVSRECFEEKIRHNEMLEYTEYCGNYYGTPKDFVDQLRSEGYDVILEIEPCGAEQVRKRCSDCISIFILPPSVEELKKRLEGRGTEQPEVIAARVAQAEREIASADRYDYRIVNDVLNDAVNEINKIFEK